MNVKINSVIELLEDISEDNYSLIAAEIAEAVDHIVRKYDGSIVRYTFMKDKKKNEEQFDFFK